jgi:hypothetical protein
MSKRQRTSDGGHNKLTEDVKEALVNQLLVLCDFENENLLVTRKHREQLRFLIENGLSEDLRAMLPAGAGCRARAQSECVSRPARQLSREWQPPSLGVGPGRLVHAG